MTTTWRYKLELPSEQITQGVMLARLNNAGSDGWEFAGTVKLQEHAQSLLVYKKPMGAARSATTR
jgi:hypothetical protein